MINLRHYWEHSWIIIIRRIVWSSYRCMYSKNCNTNLFKSRFFSIEFQKLSVSPLIQKACFNQKASACAWGKLYRGYQKTALNFSVSSIDKKGLIMKNSSVFLSNSNWELQQFANQELWYSSNRSIKMYSMEILFDAQILIFFC